LTEQDYKRPIKNAIIPQKLADYELMTEKETAALLGVSVSKLQKDRIKGSGPSFVVLGRSIRYKYKDMVSYIEANTFSSTTQASMKK